LGNSEYHAGALAALRQRPGVVVAHDVRLTGLYRLSEGRLGAVPGGLRGALARSYADRPGVENLINNKEVTADGADKLGLLMIRDVAQDAEKVLVSNPAALAMATVDVGVDLAPRLGVLPFPMALDAEELAAIAEAKSQGPAARAVVASFGLVDHSKRPMTIVRAAALVLEDTDIELCFVGPVGEALRAELLREADNLGLGERLTLTGKVDRAAYLADLGRATIALQLRGSFNGEASLAVAECMAAGVPTIVSEIGWMARLPDDCVMKMPPSAGADTFAASIAGLLADADLRAGLGTRAA
jgi:glycosyltransferase involved in cell wall biosynthesis